MAITRAQQARQMLKEGSKDPVVQGGVDNYLGKQPQVVVPRNWQSGPDKPPTELAYITKAEKDLLLKKDIHGSLKDGPNKGPGGVMSLDSFGDIGGGGAGGADTSASGGANEGSSFSGRSVSEMRGGREADQEYDRRMANERAALQIAERKQAERLGYDERENIADYGSANDLQRLYMRGVGDSNLPGFLGLGLNAISPFRDFTLRKNIDYFRGLKSRNRLSDYPQTLEGYTQYMKDRSAGTIDAAGNPLNTGDDRGPDNTVLFPQQGIMTQAPGNTDQGTETETEEDEGLRLAFRANGGRIGAMDGGIMDTDIIGGAADGNIDEMGRQMYFVGKLVKKATRAVKKIAKSPIGKAALLYAGTAGLGAFGAGAARAGTGFGIFSPTNVLSNLGASKALLTNKLFGDAVAPNMTRSGGIFSKALGLVKDNPFGAITAASAVAGLLTPAEEQEAQQLADNTGIDIEEARNQILKAAAGQDDFRARAFKADGGIMRLGYQEGSKEPVAKKTMPLLDMDGKEMDLREDGGFVPIGRMEKADDVPARLSKNEFVFTADAVRNAGDGNVDKGAEVMYNMMKNLESGGDVSEESQGLEGAREMFQTSQRLEEVL